MKFSTTFFAIAVSTVGFMASANAQSSATATATASATLITPITITVESDLVFGRITTGTLGGTVVMSAEGVASATGDLTLPTTDTRSAASFTVRGDGNSTFGIGMPSEVSLAPAVGGGEPLKININSPATTGTLDGGEAIINIAATLTVPATATAGSYTNAAGLPVTVNYN